MARWNGDGTALATGGEDGQVIIWSRAGVRRSTLVQSGTPVFDLCWSPDGTQIAYANGRDIVIKGTRAGAKPVRFRANAGCVLCLDWSPVTGSIVCGGDDGMYRVFDTIGREDYCSSPPLPHAVSAIKWSPRARLFAVGSYDLVRVCDASGWVHARRAPSSGSIYALGWSRDGAHVAAGGAAGTIFVAALSGMTCTWGPYTASVTGPKTVRLANATRPDDGVDDIQFDDAVVQLSLGYEHLIAIAPAQVVVCNVAAVHSPVRVDTRSPVSVLIQSSRFFLTYTALAGLQVYSYDGRVVTTLQVPRSVRANGLLPRHVRMSDEYVIVVDPVDLKTIYTFEVPSGRAVFPADVPDACVARPSGGGGGSLSVSNSSGLNNTGGGSRGRGSTPYKHNLEIVQISLSQATGNHATSLVAFIDSSRSLYLLPVRRHAPYKLGGITRAAMFHTTRDMLMAIMDGELVLWPFPQLVYVDPDLVPVSRIRLGTTTAGGGAKGAPVGGSVRGTGGVGAAHGVGGAGRGAGGVGGADDTSGVIGLLVREGYGLSGTDSPLDLGSMPVLESFGGEEGRVLRGDSVNITVAVSPYVSALHTQLAGDTAALIAAAEAKGASVGSGSGSGSSNDSPDRVKGPLEGAVRLCRFVRQPALWASLVAMAFTMSDWEAAEVAYAALGLVDKITYLGKIRECRKPTLQESRVALFCRRPLEAVQLMLKHGFTSRAVSTYCTMFRFKDALQVAKKEKELIPLVLWYRDQYLDDFGRTEVDDEFLSAKRAFGRIDTEEAHYLEQVGDAQDNGTKPPAVPNVVVDARARREKARAARRGSSHSDAKGDSGRRGREQSGESGEDGDDSKDNREDKKSSRRRDDDRSERRDRDRSDRDKDRGDRDKDRSDRDKDRGDRDKDRSDRDKDRSDRDKDRSDRDKDRGDRDRDRSDRDKDRGDRGDRERSDRDKDRGDREERSSPKRRRSSRPEDEGRERSRRSRSDNHDDGRSESDRKRRHRHDEESSSKSRKQEEVSKSRDHDDDDDDLGDLYNDDF